jgi:two-component system sensor histidine kinase AgrC
MTDIIFESFINLFQSVVVTVFLIISLGCKDKYNKKCVSAAGILIISYCI